MGLGLLELIIIGVVLAGIGGIIALIIFVILTGNRNK